MATAEQQALDYPELQDVGRQRKLAELLMAQGMQQPQGQMISGHYVAPSFTQQLNPLANILAGQAIGERADTKQQELATALRGRQQQIMQAYAQAKTPQEKFAIGTRADAPKELQAATYKMLEAQKAGKGDVISQLDLQTGTYKPILEGAPDLPASIQEAISLGQLPQNPTKWSPEQTAYAKQLVFQSKNAGANRQNINLQNQLPFQEQIQQEMGKDLVKEYSTLKSIPSQIQNLDKVEKLASSPAYLGSGAEAKLAITKLFNNNLGTNINADKVANTEEMRSALFQSTMENLKKVDAQPSQQQQAIMQQAFGTIGTDPSAIPKIVAVYKDILTSKANEHNTRVKQSEEGPAKMKFAYDITVKVPETQKLKVNNVRSLADQILGEK